jgi:replicative superfamily II helicase
MLVYTVSPNNWGMNMPPVIVLGDQEQLVPTESYPHAKYQFSHFNPVQSRAVEVYQEDCNCVVASPTGSGKTILAELFLAHEIRVKKLKGLYLAPMRALSQEKYDDWTSPDHHFSDLKVVICTGDYKMTPELRKRLEEADLIIMSSEMLNSKSRNSKEEQTTFLSNVGCLVVDESHLLTVKGRGDHLEAGLMKFTALNPSARIVLLSATLPNVNEIAEWVSYTLTRRKTYLIDSTFRPCKLNVHYEKYYDGERTYDDNEAQKVHSALQIVEYYGEDKFLIFTHTKKTGEMMKTALTRAGYKCEFHSADLDKKKRTELETKFRKDKDFKALVATSTLAWGCHLPARRVILVGVHRGMEEVPWYDIVQMVGRSGRPGYDPVGDAYVLVPERTAREQKSRIQSQQSIVSQMLADENGTYKVLAFHLVSEISQGNIFNKEQVHAWYKRTLANFQSKELDDAVVDRVLESLRRAGAIFLDENDEYQVTSVGKIASMFYYSPFDVSDLKRNFKSLFDNNRQDDDIHLAMALGNLDTNRAGIVSKADREEMGRFAGQVTTLYGGIAEAAVKAGYAYYTLMNGLPSNAVVAMRRGLQFDFPRLVTVLNALDQMGQRWNRREWFRRLQLRVTYGVKGDMVYLCQLPNVGKVRATKLWQSGIKTLAEVANTSPARLKSILGLKPDGLAQIIETAKTMSAG